MSHDLDVVPWAKGKISHILTRIGSSIAAGKLVRSSDGLNEGWQQSTRRWHFHYEAADRRIGGSSSGMTISLADSRNSETSDTRVALTSWLQELAADNVKISPEVFTHLARHRLEYTIDLVFFSSAEMVPTYGSPDTHKRFCRS